MGLASVYARLKVYQGNPFRHVNQNKRASGVGATEEPLICRNERLREMSNGVELNEGGGEKTR